ncbi:MAG TPA: branched-chain amino acid ABC transporter permease [Alphaproteobacteria bacterium]|nr:branched-chain amino acid ABC transporter permease [Alphaproteobacteria bacterium]
MTGTSPMAGDGSSRRFFILCLAIGAVSIVAPFVFPAIVKQLSIFWVMVIVAYTWDTMGGQLGYNSFGNIVFFGAGLYVSAIIQIAPFTNMRAYTAAGEQGSALALSMGQYLGGLAPGLIAAALVGFALAIVFGFVILGLRGHYFAIGTLALGIFIAQIFANWEYVGAGSGIIMPDLPGRGRASDQDKSLLFYFLCFALAAATIVFLRWLYATRFGLAINAIRDDEDKAEAMGIATTLYKVVAWSVSGFFLGVCGALYGNIVRFVDPEETAFDGPGLGVWMVLMAVLGGKGSLWGPLIGAVLFHATKELLWTYLLGFQNIALGLLVIIIVVFFPEGIMGWIHSRWPQLFGERVEISAQSAAAR